LFVALGCTSSGGNAGSAGNTSGGTSSSASGGNGPGAGGSSGAGTAPGSCSNTAPCGGNVVGTWSVASSCLSVSGKLSLEGFFSPDCPSAGVTGTLQVSGSWSAKADGTYVDDTTTTGTEQLTLGPACLNYSGTKITCDRVALPLQAVGYSSVTCTAAADGGCNCSATVEQHGGLGLPSADPQTNGNFTTANNAITFDASSHAFGYCAAADKMTWSPQGGTITGTVTFQPGGSTGAGGSGGAGGSSAVGGSSGAGGSSAIGGSAGVGGSASVGGSTGVGGSMGASGAAGGTAVANGPCDIYASSGTPCVAAYSTVRQLSSKYNGPLYQVRVGGSNTGTGGTLKDIGTISAGVFADGPAQDAICGSSACTIAKLYDQSGMGNDLTVAGPGCFVKTADTESNAKTRSLSVSGHKVYALYMASDSSFGSSTGPTHDGYRNNDAKGLPTGTAAQGVYEVVDGKRANAGCCWNFGNAQRDSCSTGGTGAMDTISFAQKFVWGTGAGNGPWFMGDFEGGVWAGGSGEATYSNPNNPSITWDYAFGLVKTNTANSVPQYAIRVGNSQTGGLTTAYDGAAPKMWNLQGGIVLGIGGDNSNTSYGTFFEGAITAGRPSDATDLAVLQNTQAAGYGK